MDTLKADPACEILLVSLKAGGVGLNLTSASRVYLMDPYWNPAVEHQAVDRVVSGPPVAAWGCGADGNRSTGSVRRARCSRTSS
jgi:hypothetical protein